MKKHHKNSNTPDKKHHYYYFSIHTTGREALFQEWPALQALIERTWTQTFKMYPQAHSENFVIDRNCLHGLIRIPRASKQQQVVALFITVSQEVWEKFIGENLIRSPRNLWKEPSQIKPLPSLSELENIREFIVQKLIDAEFSTPDEADETNPDKDLDWE